MKVVIIEVMSFFDYLGSCFTEDGSSQEDVKRKVGED